MAKIASLEGGTRSVVAAIDFEPAARAALVYAAREAWGAGVPLTVLHVVHEPAEKPNYFRRNGGTDVLLPMEVLAERRLEEFLADVQRQNPGLSSLDAPGILLVKGLPVSRIPEVAKRLGAAQIVMGRNRSKRLFRGLFASLSDRVAAASEIPVTVIGSDGKSKLVNRPALKDLDDKLALGA